MGNGAPAPSPKRPLSCLEFERVWAEEEARLGPSHRLGTGLPVTRVAALWRRWAPGTNKGVVVSYLRDRADNGLVRAAVLRAALCYSDIPLSRSLESMVSKPMLLTPWKKGAPARKPLPPEPEPGRFDWTPPEAVAGPWDAWTLPWEQLPRDVRWLLLRAYLDPFTLARMELVSAAMRTDIAQCEAWRRFCPGTVLPKVFAPRDWRTFALLFAEQPRSVPIDETARRHQGRPVALEADAAVLQSTPDTPQPSWVYAGYQKRAHVCVHAHGPAELAGRTLPVLVHERAGDALLAWSFFDLSLTSRHFPSMLGAATLSVAGQVKTLTLLDDTHSAADFVSVADLIVHGAPRPAPIVRALLGQLIIAITDAAREGLILMDLRSDALCIDRSGVLRVLYSEWLSRIQHDDRNDEVFGGTYWLSPEVIRGHPRTAKICTWGVGTCAYELLTGEPPFIEFPPMRALFLLSTKGVPPVDRGTVDSSLHGLCHLIERCCFVTDAEERPLASNLLAHEWFCEGPCATPAQLVEWAFASYAGASSLDSD